MFNQVQAKQLLKTHSFSVQPQTHRCSLTIILSIGTPMASRSTLHHNHFLSLVDSRGCHIGKTPRHVYTRAIPVYNLWSIICPKAHLNLGETSDQQAMIVLSMVDINGLIGMH